MMTKLSVKYSEKIFGRIIVARHFLMLTVPRCLPIYPSIPLWLRGTIHPRATAPKRSSKSRAYITPAAVDGSGPLRERRTLQL